MTSVHTEERCCTHCGTWKPLDRFSFEGGRYRSGCRDCRNRRRREAYSGAPFVEKKKLCEKCGAPFVFRKHTERFCSDRCRWKARGRAKLLKSYGLKEVDFEWMLTQQNNSCSICKRQFTETPRIDHDHSCCPGVTSCGKCVRSLLCHRCNVALGLFSDDTEVLNEAIKYLEAHKTVGSTH